ncbi:MAG: nucleotidyl transferase AbiEii/AbiGii toxin family protein [Acidimicrobiia bacterium]
MTTPPACLFSPPQVADETGIPAAHVEKDFWVTEVLRGVVAGAVASKVVMVFKGGTSLSKAYGIIERFSEDVDGVRRRSDAL